jgi:hypothetical protein
VSETSDKRRGKEVIHNHTNFPSIPRVFPKECCDDDSPQLNSKLPQEIMVRFELELDITAYDDMVISSIPCKKHRIISLPSIFHCPQLSTLLSGKSRQSWGMNCVGLCHVRFSPYLIIRLSTCRGLVLLCLGWLLSPPIPWARRFLEAVLLLGGIYIGAG